MVYGGDGSGAAAAAGGRADKLFASLAGSIRKQINGGDRCSRAPARLLAPETPLREPATGVFRGADAALVWGNTSLAADR